MSSMGTFFVALPTYTDPYREREREREKGCVCQGERERKSLRELEREREKMSFRALERERNRKRKQNVCCMGGVRKCTQVVPMFVVEKEREREYNAHVPTCNVMKEDGIPTQVRQ